MVKKVVIGLLSGLMCGMFSSGGGLILVPTFIYFLNFSDKEAKANSIFCILPMVIISSIIYQTSINIDYRLVFLCCTGEIIGSMLGSILLNKLEPKFLKIIFIFFLIYAGLKNLL